MTGKTNDTGSEGDHDTAHMVRADLVTGLLLLALGLLFAYLSWSMPRLENRGVIAVTAPGLVPGILGVVLALLGRMLAARSVGSFGDRHGWRAFMATLTGSEARRAGAVMLLALLYPLVLVGNMPFALATAIFVFGFVMLFDCFMTDAPLPRARTAVMAAILAVITAAIVVGVFERGFLVRLP